VVEFLKNKGDFETLHLKHKKPFRAHINKHLNVNLPLVAQAHQSITEPFNANSALDNSANSYSGEFFASDGFNSIKCLFSEQCKEQFEHRYPKSLKIYNTVNMLICIQSYQLFIKSLGDDLPALP
jgi:hypothetical protein